MREMDRVVGAYADLVNVNRTEHDFVVDFAVSLLPTASTGFEARDKIPAAAVARIRLHPPVAFALRSRLDDAIRAYVESFPPILPPPEGGSDATG